MRSTRETVLTAYLRDLRKLLRTRLPQSWECKLKFSGDAELDAANLVHEFQQVIGREHVRGFEAGKAEACAEPDDFDQDWGDDGDDVGSDGECLLDRYDRECAIREGRVLA